MEGGGHIESWTADEVVAFLSKLELDQYSDDFMGNEITGDILIHLDHESLRDIGVESVGHRLNILRAVYETKISDNVTIEPDHYVPATADLDSSAGATNSDLARDLTTITQAIQVRDERLLSAEAEIKRLTEHLTRLKDQLSPVFKIVKELQPLPTPDMGTNQSLQSQSSLSRKFSTKKLFLGSAPKQPSPTHTPPAFLYNEPESPHSPNRYTDFPPVSSSSRSQTPNQHGLSALVESPGMQPTLRQAPPPRPPPPGLTPLTVKREISSSRSDHRPGTSTGQQQDSSFGLNSAASSSILASATPTQTMPVTNATVTANTANTFATNTNTSTTTTTSSSSNSASTSASNATIDSFKSFRVGLDDPCSKVLPAALKKYRINSDWREYSLFICYADQERCLGMEEKPLLVFQELQRANKSPVFMLRKLEAGTTSVLPVRGGHAHGGGGGGAGHVEQEVRF